MPRKSAPAKVKAAAATPSTDNPCQDCEGSGAVAGTARGVKVQGQTAICLTCLGTGQAT